MKIKTQKFFGNFYMSEVLPNLSAHPTVTLCSQMIISYLDFYIYSRTFHAFCLVSIVNLLCSMILLGHDTVTPKQPNKYLMFQ
jgi:hypothetical protein